MLLMRLAGWLFFPLSICLFLLLLGTVLLWFGRPRSGRCSATLGAVLLTLFSLGPVGDALLGPFERGTSPVRGIQDLPDEWKTAKWIVVLGGGHRPDPSVPLSARPSAASLIRFVEGIRLHRRLPKSKLVVTVGEPEGEDTRADDMRELGRDLGLEDDDCRVVAGPRNTDEEAAALADLLQGERCLLVTSAAHMPRAAHLFARRGIDAFPVPTDYVAIRNEYALLHSLPSAGNLQKTQGAFYESLARIAAHFR